MEAKVLAVKAQIDAINAEIQGMAAMNQYRALRNEVIAYNEKDFFDKAEELRAISDMIMNYMM